jgi:hypothetical protein
MPVFSLTEVYMLESSRMDGETQTVSLKAKYGDRHTVIRGIPSDVDLSGNIRMQTWHIGDLEERNLSNVERKVAEANPDKVSIYKVDNQENIIPNSGADLFRKEDGTYRHRTVKEAQNSDKMNASIIASLLSSERKV